MMKKIILTLFISIQAFSQNADSLITLSRLLKNNSLELSSWKYKSGDDLGYSSVSLNDFDWETTSSLMESNRNIETIFDDIIWFRGVVNIDSSLVSVPLFLHMNHNGASQIFIDGKLIRAYGNPAKNSSEESVINPLNSPVSIAFKEKGKHILAIRYSNHNTGIFKKLFKYSNGGFALDIGLLNTPYSENFGKNGIFSNGFLVIFGFILALSLLHFLIYLFYKEQRSNLNYSLFTLGLAGFIILFELQAHSSNPLVILISSFYRWRVFVLAFIFLLKLVYSIVYDEIPKKLKQYTNIISSIILVILFLMPFINDRLIYILIAVCTTSSCSICGILISKAQKNKHEGIKIVGRGFQFFLYSAGLLFILSISSILSFNPDSWKGFFVFCFLAVSILSIPVTMSTYLALSFARTTKQLKLKLKQVETLSAKTLEQEIEKKNMIERQKEELEIQVKIRTAEVVQQKYVIETKQKEMLDSLKYASRIQRALITSEQYIKRKLNELNNKDQKS